MESAFIKTFVGWANKNLLRRYSRNGSFKKLEGDHSVFYNAMQQIPSSYKWPKRPLYEWSRRVEYPFATDNLPDMEHCRILDAGSGVTFFPYHLVKHYGHQVECLDSDGTFSSIMANVLNKLDSRIKIPFHTGYLTQNLQFPNKSFDVVMSISVLEHIQPDMRLRALSELWRITKSGGRILITLDVSLDGRAEGIALKDLREFLKRLSEITSSELLLGEDTSSILTPQSPGYSLLPVIVAKKREIIRPSLKSIYFDITNKPLPNLGKLACLLIVIPKPREY